MLAFNSYILKANRGTTIETNKRGQNRPRNAYGERNKDREGNFVLEVGSK